MFSRCTKCALALAFLFIPKHTLADDHAGHDHGDEAGEIESCACAALEDDHPFTIDCSNSAAVQSAYDSFLSEDCGALEGEGGVAKCDDMDHYALTCVTYYFIVKAHHDYCEHDEIPIAVENGFHDLEEAKCHECSMSRKHIAGLPNCPEVDCEDPGVLTMAYDALKTTASCTDAEDGCCSNDAEKGAWKVMMAYHDTCHAEDVPTAVEAGVHDWEEACESAMCNTVHADDPDPAVCVQAEKKKSKSDGPLMPTLVAIVLFALAVLLIMALTFACCLSMSHRRLQTEYANLLGREKANGRV